MLDLDREMRLNSKKKAGDSFATKGKILLYYNTSEKRIGFEYFEIDKLKKGLIRYNVFQAENYNVDELWKIEGGLGKLVYLMNLIQFNPFTDLINTNFDLLSLKTGS